MYDNPESRSSAARPVEPLGPRDAEIHGEVSLLAIINILLRERLFIASLTAMCVVPVATLSLMSARSWTATASFMPSARRAPSSLSSVAAQFGVQVPIGGADAGQSPAFYADLVKSREIMGAVVTAKYDVLQDGRRAAKPLDIIYETGENEPAARKARAMRLLSLATTANAAQRTGVVSFSVTAFSPTLAHQIADRGPRLR